MNKEKKQIYLFDHYYLMKNAIKWQDFINVFSLFLAHDCCYYKLHIYSPKKEFKNLRDLFGIFPRDQVGKEDILHKITKLIEQASDENLQSGFDFRLYDSINFDEDNWKVQMNDFLTQVYINCTESDFLKFKKYLIKNHYPEDLIHSGKDQICISKFIGSRCFSPKEYKEYKNNNQKK